MGIRCHTFVAFDWSATSAVIIATLHDISQNIIDDCFILVSTPFYLFWSCIGEWFLNYDAIHLCTHWMHKDLPSRSDVHPSVHEVSLFLQNILRLWRNTWLCFCSYIIALKIMYHFVNFILPFCFFIVTDWPLKLIRMTEKIVVNSKFFYWSFRLSRDLNVFLENRNWFEKIRFICVLQAFQSFSLYFLRLVIHSSGASIIKVIKLIIT